MQMVRFLAIVFLFVVFFSSCAPGPNDMERTSDDEGKVAGFWKGLWHGLIAPITFIISVFTDKVHLYEVHNNGTWYNFGFVVGAGLFFSGGIFGHRKKRKKSK